MSDGLGFSDWNAYAVHYDALTKLRPYVQMHEEVVGAIAEYGRGPLLDAGCGTGNLTSHLLASKDTMHLRTTALDSSIEMIERARYKCNGKLVHFVQTDMNARLPFGNGDFGTIVCVNALYAVKDPLVTLREFNRILCPLGTLVIATPKKGYENGLILKEHCGSDKPDEYWRNAHQSPEREEKLLREAVRNEGMRESIALIAQFNRSIAETVSFHFFTEEELLWIILDAGFTVMHLQTTYAQQSFLLVARKPEGGHND